VATLSHEVLRRLLTRLVRLTQQLEQVTHIYMFVCGHARRHAMHYSLYGTPFIRRLALSVRPARAVGKRHLYIPSCDRWRSSTTRSTRASPLALRTGDGRRRLKGTTTARTAASCGPTARSSCGPTGSDPGCWPKARSSRAGVHEQAELRDTVCTCTSGSASPARLFILTRLPFALFARCLRQTCARYPLR